LRDFADSSGTNAETMRDAVPGDLGFEDDNPASTVARELAKER
jgi:hypothetical protein